MRAFLQPVRNYFFSSVDFVSPAFLSLQQDLPCFLHSLLQDFLFLSSPFLSSPKVEADIEVAPTKEANARVKNIFFIVKANICYLLICFCYFSLKSTKLRHVYQPGGTFYYLLFHQKLRKTL